MNQPQHTPGPWTAEKGSVSLEKKYYVTDGHGFIIAATSSNDECNEHNAQLIAAAPAMLDALAYVVNWHREHDSGGGELFGLDYVTACISALHQADPGWHTAPTPEAHAND